MKLTKKIAALGVSTVMAVSMMSIGASASGSVTFSSYNTVTKKYLINITYQDITEQKAINLLQLRLHHKIYIFLPSSPSGATIYFTTGNNNRYGQVVVPKRTAGMPSTIFTTRSLSNGTTYTPEVIPDSGDSAAGSFNVSNTAV